MGPEERGYLRVLQDFTRGFDPGARMVAVPASGDVRAYGLSGPSAYAVYVHSSGDQAVHTSGVTISVNPAFQGAAEWISPATGEILGRSEIPAGPQKLTVPAFVADIALKVLPPPTHRR